MSENPLAAPLYGLADLLTFLTAEPPVICPRCGEPAADGYGMCDRCYGMPDPLPPSPDTGPHMSAAPCCPIDEQNTRRTTRGTRSCKTCQRESLRRGRAARRARAAA
jgi:hypothetical protein